MRRVLFISNGKYINPASTEGGVKLCTREYIDLIKTHYDVELFPVELNRSIFYRVKKKLGIDAYEDYAVNNYTHTLKKLIVANKIDYVFLNLSNTVGFSMAIKRLFPSLKIILCSHGNESGDFLHEIARHRHLRGIKEIAARYRLGKMLALESFFRKYLDVVLTVSGVELNIEKWLGTEKVYMVARSLKGEPVSHSPVSGRIGFFGDLSHAPNFYGITELCEILKKQDTGIIELRLVSSQQDRGKALEKEFSFVKYLGYLAEDELRKEAATWTFCVNPVFYYSRGVSTKMGKAIGMGIPVITTKKGMRGYQWKQGEILSCTTKEDMAQLILKHATNLEHSLFYRNEILKMQASSPALSDMMEEVSRLIEND